MPLIRQTQLGDKPSVKIVGETLLIMKRETSDRIRFLVENSPIEIQWFSSIERVTNPSIDPNNYVYLISNVFIPEQEAGEKEVESTHQQISNMWKEIRDLRKLDSPTLSELMKVSTFWGHSHVSAPTKPSSTDDERWAEMTALAKKSSDPKITGMIIFNKGGEYSNRIFDPISKLEMWNVPLYINDELDYAYEEHALKSKLSKKAPPKALPPLSNYQQEAFSKGGGYGGVKHTNNVTTVTSGSGSLEIRWPEDTVSKKDLAAQENLEQTYGI